MESIRLNEELQVQLSSNRELTIESKHLSHYFLTTHKKNKLENYQDITEAEKFLPLMREYPVDNQDITHISQRAYYTDNSKFKSLLQSVFEAGEENKTYYYFLFLPKTTCAIVMQRTQNDGWIKSYNPETPFQYRQCTIKQTTTQDNIEILAQKNESAWQPILDFLHLKSKLTEPSNIALLSLEKVEIHKENSDKVFVENDDIEDRVTVTIDSDKNLKMLSSLIKNGHYGYAKNIPIDFQEWIKIEDIVNLLQHLNLESSLYQAISYGYTKTVHNVLAQFINMISSPRLASINPQEKAEMILDLFSVSQAKNNIERNLSGLQVACSKGDLCMVSAIYEFLKPFIFQTDTDPILNYQQAIELFLPIFPDSPFGLYCAFHQKHYHIFAFYFEKLFLIKGKEEDIRNRLCGLFKFDFTKMVSKCIEKKYITNTYLTENIIHIE